MKVTLNQEEEFQHVAGVIDNNEEVYYRELSLAHQDQDELRFKVLALALENLQKKRAIYEKSLNLKLTPRNFDEAKISESIQIAGFHYSESDRGQSWNIKSSFSRAGSDTQTPVYGAMIMNATISVEYIVEQ